MKNCENLTIEQKEVLEKVLSVSTTLKTCYELKEAFRVIFNDSTNKDEASDKLCSWILNIVKDDIYDYFPFVETLLHWKDNILNYFIGGLSSGFLEGVNNKIKLIKRKGFGFSNFDNFRTRVIDNFG